MPRRTIAVIAFVLVLLTSLPGICDILPAEAIDAIYIRADGSIDPQNAHISTSDNRTYTLLYNITSSIMIERDNIVLRGAGYTLQGDGSSVGVSMIGRRNVNITGMKIRGFFHGIYLENSSGNTISTNSISNNNYGIQLGYSSNTNDLRGNNVTGSYVAIELLGSSNNILRQNRIYANQKGLLMGSSAHNAITENSFMSNSMCAIETQISSDNNISWNNITSNTDGIDLVGNILYEHTQWNNTISWNNIVSCDAGITLSGSSGNLIISNNVYGCQQGISLYSSAENNKIYHNKFANVVQFYFAGGVAGNIWDDGYPYGGNFWGDYLGSDNFGGPYQNVTGSDGIGDTPYGLEISNQDRYPFMESEIPIVGDVNQDGKVDIKDIYRVAQAYGSCPGQTKWDSACDINKDEEVDIRDYYLVCKNYGKDYP